MQVKCCLFAAGIMNYPKGVKEAICQRGTARTHLLLALQTSSKQAEGLSLMRESLIRAWQEGYLQSRRRTDAQNMI